MTFNENLLYDRIRRDTSVQTDPRDARGRRVGWPGRGADEVPADEASPLAALRGPAGLPLRVAILSDFLRIPYANGAVFQTRFLYRRLRAAGHEVTLIGPGDPEARADELAPGSLALPSLPLPLYRGLRLPLPPAPWTLDDAAWDFDLVFAQTNSLLALFGVWLRETRGTPLLCVNTTHLAAAYDVLLPASLARHRLAHAAIRLGLRGPCERLYASIYNASDGLVVLSEGLREHWRERGVTAPIHVVPRAVAAEVYDAPAGADPYPALLGSELAGRGRRLVCAGSHRREKEQDRVIRVFARQVLPREPDATLTLVGRGPETAAHQQLARACGAGDRVFFVGEVAYGEMPSWYSHADLFVHASLSETYGNVLGEALWCGCPVVAFADGMGASAQIIDGVNGRLLQPGDDEDGWGAGDEAMGSVVVELLRDGAARARLGKAAVEVSRRRTSPHAVEQRLAAAFTAAREHAGSQRLRQEASRRSAAERWLIAVQRFAPWALTHVVLSGVGHLRPPAPWDGPTHPAIWK